MALSNSWFTRPLLGRVTLAGVWTFFIRFVCPAVVFVMLLNMFGVKFF
jgi:hypothetical protein